MRSCILTFLLAITLFVGVEGVAATEPVQYSSLISPSDNPVNISNNTRWGGSLRLAIRMVVNYFLYFLGLVATVMVIYAGALYITAGGDDTKIEEAKKVIVYVAVGIIVTLMSFAFVDSVILSGLGGPPPTYDFDTIQGQSGQGRPAIPYQGGGGDSIRGVGPGYGGAGANNFSSGFSGPGVAAGASGSGSGTLGEIANVLGNVGAAAGAASGAFGGISTAIENIRR